MYTCEFRPGQTIFAQGDPGDRLYLIAEGTVTISLRDPAGRTGVRAILGPADIFGELAVFDPALARAPPLHSPRCEPCGWTAPPCARRWRGIRRSPNSCCGR